MVVVILYMGVGFVQQASVSQERQDDLREIEEQIAVAQQESQALEKYLEYVRSPAAAEAWGRENGWTRDDEVSVVVVAPPGEASAPEIGAPEGGVEAGSNREGWWDLFFGPR
jgi:hypothetical protein